MLVEIVKTFTDPGGNVHLAGSQEHVRTSTAEQYFDWKVAKRPEYKTFKEAMDAKEKERVSALPKSAAPATGWGIKESTSNDPNAPRFLVVKTTPTGETFFFDSPPSDAPPFIKQRFADAVVTNAAQFTDRAAFLKQQQEDYARQHDGTQSEAAGIALTIIGARGVGKRG
jgi:hypothetical protein